MLDGVERVLRHVAVRTGWFLLVLHLSRIGPPGPRPHHRRVAAAVLDDVAGRSSGQLFALGNGDVAMLFRPPDDGSGVSALIARLFQADVPDLEQLRSLWPLPASADPALGYVRARLADSDLRVPEAEPLGSAVESVAALLQAQSVDELLTRQTAIVLRPGRDNRIVPLFRTVGVSRAAAQARIDATGHVADPFLLGHLAARFDQHMLDTLRRGRIPPLADDAENVALQIRLTLGGILSEAFARFAASRAGDEHQVDIEVPFIDMVADPKGATLARERLRLAGMRLVLGGMTPPMLLASQPAVLQPHLVLLEWQPSVPVEATLRAAVERCGRERVVLSQCDDEAALVWGLALGIQRFRGGFVDTLLAAERLRACAHAAACSLRQCRSRSASGSAEGRDGCGDRALLDRGMPAAGAR